MKTTAIQVLEQHLIESNKRIGELKEQIKEELRRVSVVQELLAEIIKAEKGEEDAAIVHMPPDQHKDSLEAAKKRIEQAKSEMEGLDL